MKGAAALNPKNMNKNPLIGLNFGVPMTGSIHAINAAEHVVVMSPKNIFLAK